MLEKHSAAADADGADDASKCHLACRVAGGIAAHQKLPELLQEEEQDGEGKAEKRPKVSVLEARKPTNHKTAQAHIPR